MSCLPFIFEIFRYLLDLFFIWNKKAACKIEAILPTLLCHFIPPSIPLGWVSHKHNAPFISPLSNGSTKTTTQKSRKVVFHIVWMCNVVSIYVLFLSSFFSSGMLFHLFFFLLLLLCLAPSSCLLMTQKCGEKKKLLSLCSAPVHSWVGQRRIAVYPRISRADAGLLHNNREVVGGAWRRSGIITFEAE